MTGTCRRAGVVLERARLDPGQGWCLVQRAGDRDRHRRRAGAAVPVVRAIRERVGRRLALRQRPQRRRARRVIGEGAVRVHRDRGAHGARAVQRGRAAGAVQLIDRERVERAVGVVGEHALRGGHAQDRCSRSRRRSPGLAVTTGVAGGGEGIPAAGRDFPAAGGDFPAAGRAWPGAGGVSGGASWAAWLDGEWPAGRRGGRRSRRRWAARRGVARRHDPEAVEVHDRAAIRRPCSSRSRPALRARTPARPRTPGPRGASPTGRATRSVRPLAGCRSHDRARRPAGR